MAYSLTSGVALTFDEYNELRAEPFAPPAATRPAPQSSLEMGRRIYKTMNEQDLAVRFSESGAFFTVEIRDAAALLDLVQARDLAAVLSGTLDGWRAETISRP